MLDKSAKKCCRALIIKHFYGGADMSFTVAEIRKNLVSVPGGILRYLLAHTIELVVL